MQQIASLVLLVMTLFLPSGRVTQVIDGDTLIVNNSQKIRILGIDAPEINNCYGPQSKQLLEELVLGRKVKYKTLRKDLYKRELASLWIHGDLVAEKMLEMGVARPDYTDKDNNEQLKKAYSKAKSSKTGLFAGVCQSQISPRDNCQIKGNIEANTGKRYYHLPDCRHYKQIVLDLDRGEKWFCSEKEAEDAGFKLAGGCK